jgi:uncharacterized protein YbjT (DUF2867 family)
MTGWVGLTGASGLVGRSLADACARAGSQVRALPREGSSDLRGLQTLIHCGRDPRGGAINVETARQLFERARAAGAERIVFVSSLAADADSASAYGREKAAIEALLDASRDLVLRPGLVIGDGGAFAAMSRALRRFRIAPLVAGGGALVYTIDAERLGREAAAMIAAGATGVHALTDPEPMTLRALYTFIARREGIRIAYVPVPYRALLLTASLLERVGLRSPIAADRVRGLRNLQAGPPA